MANKNVDQQMEIKPQKKSFNPVAWDLMLGLDTRYADKRFIVQYGGAGSGKSRGTAQIVLFKHLLPNNPDGVTEKILVLRKVASTLRDSVFAEYKELVESAGLSGIVDVTTTPMRIINKVNGNQIIFKGLDDPEKVKSITNVTKIVMEEATEFSIKDFLQLNSRMRGKKTSTDGKNSGFKFRMYICFNPTSAEHWLKSYFVDEDRPNALVIHTTYKDNRFIDDDYVKELLDYENTDPEFYSIYTLGLFGKSGDMIYTRYKLKVADVSRNEDHYDYVWCGVDFGFKDPNVLLRIGIKDGDIYIIDEIYRSGLTNKEFISLIKKEMPKVLKNNETIISEVNPGFIKEFKQHGFNIRPAKKGRHSIRLGIDYVKRFDIIVSDRCPKFAWEIARYQWKKTSHGDVLDEPRGGDDHAMDAFRYAMYERYRTTSSRGKGRVKRVRGGRW